MSKCVGCLDRYWLKKILAKMDEREKLVEAKKEIQ